MTIQLNVFPIYPAEFPQIVAVWEASVRETHHFVSEADILFFRPLVQKWLPQMKELACVRDQSGAIAGFIAVNEGNVDMLFIAPAARGQGAGRQLLTHAITTYGARTLDVNEQNEQAVGFYLRMGFEVVGRSAVDGTGKSYPLLHLRLTLAGEHA
jgi:putative acetyltransferase